MKYVNVPAPKSELLSLVGTLAKRLDWNIYGSQMVDAKKSKVAIWLRHTNNALYIGFEGFGDLFGHEALLHCNGRSIASNFIGIDNDVCLHYEEYLPTSGIKLNVIPVNELS